MPEPQAERKLTRVIQEPPAGPDKSFQPCFLLSTVIVALAAIPLVHAETTLGTEARTDLALTIYGNGLGLASDWRWVVLSKELNSLTLDGLSPQIITDSLVTELSGGALVLSRERQTANLTPRHLMAATVGKAGYLIRSHCGTGAEISPPATLLPAQGGVVARIGGRVALNPAGRWAFDQVPARACRSLRAWRSLSVMIG